jgi:Fur family ferric uptake transcriptional regulator
MKKENQTLRRNTTQRKAIEQVFRERERPLGVDEILEYGRKLVKSLNQATVYRNLKLLIEDGWLKRISHPSLGALYERTGRAHHHHFHCRECNRAFELPGCALKEDAAPDGYVVEDHEIFLFGVCPSCVEVTR